MNKYQPFDDGLTQKQRSKMRAHTWRTVGIEKEKAVTRWMEKLCSECSKWNHRDRPEEWCEHFRDQGTPADAPAAHVFQPYFNPNIQPGGAFLRSRSDERRCMRLNHKEFVG